MAKSAKKIDWYLDSSLLRQLCEVQATSGHEVAMKSFLLNYLKKNSKNWKTKPEIIHGEALQDCIILKFGKPRTAIFFSPQSLASDSAAMVIESHK